jgi:hypothetical protein
MDFAAPLAVVFIIAVAAIALFEAKGPESLRLPS